MPEPTADSPGQRKAQTRALFDRLVADYEATGAGAFTHFGRRLVAAAAVGPGQRVLDVATGRGAVLLPAVEAVGPTGEVVGIDLSPGMVATTRAETARQGVAVRLEEMDAEQLDFPDQSFDRGLCGFGVMFFPNQVRALQELRRVLRPGGRLGISTWQTAQTEDLGSVLRELGLSAAAPPGWITDGERLSQLLETAGFRDVQVRVETEPIRYADLAAYWRVALGTGQRPVLDALDADQQGAVRVRLAERLQPFQQPAGFQVPATALLAIATR